MAKGIIAVADFSVSSTQDKNTKDVSAYALTGLRYEINDYLDIDAGIKFGLATPETDVTALYGLVLKF